MYQSLKTAVAGALLTFSQTSFAPRTQDERPKPLNLIQPTEKQAPADAVKVLLTSFNPQTPAEQPQSQGKSQSTQREEPTESERYQKYRPQVAQAEQAYSNRSEAALWGKLQSAILVNTTTGDGASTAAFLKDFRNEITKAIMDGDSPSKDGLLALQKKYDAAFWKKLGINKPTGDASISVSGNTGDLLLVIKDESGRELHSTKDTAALQLYGAATFCGGAANRIEKKGPDALVVSWGQLDAQLFQAIERAERK